MKTSFSSVAFIGSLVLSFCVLASFNIKKKECDRQQLLEKAVPKLKKFTLIQDYPFSFKKKKKNGDIEVVNNAITLNRGIRYKFYAVKNEEFEGIPMIYIYNNAKHEFLIASSYNSTYKKFYDEIEFECKTTGNYCLTFCFQDGLEGCGLGVFASNVKE